MKKDLNEIVLSKNMFKQNDTVVCALSGGVDSMVLFDVLKRLPLDLNIIVAHVNHNKRNESINEYKEIELLCEEHNVIFEGLELEKDIQGNFHDVSRKRRYEFFYKVAVKHHATSIVLGHHNDDQLETILMRIVRGSSFGGYAGIKDEIMYKDVVIQRPLLSLTKEDILQYAKKENITYFEDSSNTNPVYTRNRFRNDIIPLIKEENPNIQKQINQFSEYMNMAEEFVSKNRDDFLTKYDNHNININDFNALLPILKINILKFIINSKTYDTVEVSYKQYEDMIALLKSNSPNLKYSLSNGYNLVKSYDTFYVDEVSSSKSVSLEITEVGEYSISQDRTYVFSYEKCSIKSSDYIELCYNDEVFPLYLRNRENGDKMKLQVGTKKVKDILIDQKIPTPIRENLILLASRDKVLWIPTIKKSLQDKSCSKKLYVYEVK